MERQDKVVLTLDSYEHGIMIRALNELRNDMLEEQRDPGPVEDVLLKTIDAPAQKDKKAKRIGIYLSSRRNYRRGEEHGSAKWGDPRAVNKKYRDKDPIKNRIFTQHVRMGLDGRKHRRNLNTLVVGGSGAGKSRFYGKVNICQCNTSLFVLDCKGELLRDCGGLLEQMGYEIKVVDLLNMEKSHCYNPFAYLKSDNDVQKMVTNLFKATTPKGS